MIGHEKSLAVRAESAPLPSKSGPRVAGRPRSAEVERAIIDAALDHVESHGLSGLSIEGIAATAGVGKTTIYRRWPNKEALVLDALGSLQEPLPELPGTSVRDDLVTLVEAVRRKKADSRAARLLPCVMGEAHRHPELARQYVATYVEPRREVMREVLRRGMRTGELRSDLDLEVVQAMLTGAVMHFATVSMDPTGLPTDLPERVVDTVLAGLAPR
jgi:AcrR family transcriptional regulator